MPESYKREDVDIEAMSAPVKKLFDKWEAIEPIPPYNGKSYANSGNRYAIGNGNKIILTERGANFAKLLASGCSETEAFIKAGWNIYGIFVKYNNVEDIRKYLKGKINKAKTPKVTALREFLQYDSAKEMSIDAKWLLNEQVSLYRQCREEKKYTQAVRLLHDISYHVDVDARISNRIEIDQKIDYAQILKEADNRTIEGTLEEDNIIPLELVKEENG